MGEESGASREQQAGREAEGGACLPGSTDAREAPQSSLLAPRSPYRVRLDLFEGPLDLLLHLIKKSEVDIANIPVATIAEQYLAYLALLQELNLDIAGEYLVMAATLTLIKSRTLLPSAAPDQDEEADPRADLVRRLLEYQRFREAAQALGERPRLGREVFVREPSAEGVGIGADGAPVLRVTRWELLEAFRTALQRARPEAVHDIEGESVSLRERALALLRTLSLARSLAFDSFFDEDASRQAVIVTFLALLELMRLGAMEAVQEEPLGPILIVLAVDDVSAVTLDLADEDEGGGPRVEESSDG